MLLSLARNLAVRSPNVVRISMPCLVLAHMVIRCLALEFWVATHRPTMLIRKTALHVRCAQSHSLMQCPDFKALKVCDCICFVQNHKLCIVCMITMLHLTVTAIIGVLYVRRSIQLFCTLAIHLLAMPCLLVFVLCQSSKY